MLSVRNKGLSRVGYKISYLHFAIVSDHDPGQPIFSQTGPNPHERVGS